MPWRCRFCAGPRRPSPIVAQCRLCFLNSPLEDCAALPRGIRVVPHLAGGVLAWMALLVISGGSVSETYISSDNEIIQDADDAACSLRSAVLVFPEAYEIDVAAIAEQSSGQQLVVDVLRSCPQILRINHVDQMQQLG